MKRNLVTKLVSFTRCMTRGIYSGYGYSEKVAREDADDIVNGFLYDFFFHLNYFDGEDEGNFKEAALGKIVEMILSKAHLKEGKSNPRHRNTDWTLDDYDLDMGWTTILRDLKYPRAEFWDSGLVLECQGFAVNYCDFVCCHCGIEDSERRKMKMNIIGCSRTICSHPVPPRLRKYTRTTGQKFKLLKDTIDYQAMRYMKMREEQKAQNDGEAGK